LGERRPLQSRDARWAKATASFLAARRVPPNAISIGSVVFAAIAGAALLLGQAESLSYVYVVAAIAIQLRLICNLLDGMVAVEGKLGSKSGEIYNDLPDRIADPLILVAAGYATPYPFLGWCAGLLAVFTAYTRLLGAATGAGQDFRGPMAKPQRMAVMTIAAVVQMFTPYALTAALALIILGCVVTIARRTANIKRILESK
jgi:phosphatidylglycerophosphate synthase